MTAAVLNKPIDKGFIESTKDHVFTVEFNGEAYQTVYPEPLSELSNLFTSEADAWCELIAHREQHPQGKCWPIHGKETAARHLWDSISKAATSEDKRLTEPFVCFGKGTLTDQVHQWLETTFGETFNKLAIQKRPALTPDLGINVSENSMIVMIRFISLHPIAVNEFCDDAQEILYDVIGSTGHFRVAPALKEDLNESFITAVSYKKKSAFYPRNDNELYAAFFIESIDPDVSINDELQTFSTELHAFCDECRLTAEQVNIDSMY